MQGPRNDEDPKNKLAKARKLKRAERSTNNLGHVNNDISQIKTSIRNNSLCVGRVTIKPRSIVAEVKQLQRSFNHVNSKGAKFYFNNDDDNLRKINLEENDPISLPTCEMNITKQLEKIPIRLLSDQKLEMSNSSLNISSKSIPVSQNNTIPKSEQIMKKKKKNPQAKTRPGTFFLKPNTLAIEQQATKSQTMDSHAHTTHHISHTMAAINHNLDIAESIIASIARHDTHAHQPSDNMLANSSADVKCMSVKRKLYFIARRPAVK